MSDFDSMNYVDPIPESDEFAAICPGCPYVSPPRTKHGAARSLRDHWLSKHKDEPVPQPTERPILTLHADLRTADQRVEDLAFENRIKRLTEQRRWNELRALMKVYESALADRYGASG